MSFIITWASRVSRCAPHQTYSNTLNELKEPDGIIFQDRFDILVKAISFYSC